MGTSTSMASTWMENLQTKIGYSSNINTVCRFRCEDNNVALTHVQPHYNRVQQVEPCHHLG